MKTNRFYTLVAIGLLCFGILIASDVEAFDYTGAAWCCENDILYCINPEEPDTVCGPNPRSIIDVVNAAAASWNAQGTAWQLVYGGTTTDRGCVLARRRVSACQILTEKMWYQWQPVQCRPACWLRPGGSLLQHQTRQNAVYLKPISVLPTTLPGSKIKTLQPVRDCVTTCKAWLHTNLATGNLSATKMMLL